MSVEDLTALHERLVDAHQFMRLIEPSESKLYSDLPMIVGSVQALQPNDWLAPDADCALAMAYTRGVPVKALMPLTSVCPNEEGFESPRHKLYLPMGSASAHCLHAVGMAWAMHYQDEPQAIVTVFRAEEAHEASIHQALNFASVRQAPVVFLGRVTCPQALPTSTLAQLGIGYGLASERVDAGDPCAILEACRVALKRARERLGPTLIEVIDQDPPPKDAIGRLKRLILQQV